MRLEASARSPAPRAKRLDVPSAFAAFVLDELVGGVERFRERGQGWSGHLLTTGRALLDIQALGFTDLAACASRDFAAYVARLRLGPLDTDKPRRGHERLPFGPRDADYWAAKRGDWGLGHVVKYPYGFHKLIGALSDAPRADDYREAARALW